ncbi:hypothetical protein CEXT_667571 [Caerostris extrusa]|uniref:Uncharacterized protein n=1 Tax=Caerostris extrusa TaxID=172846 RepID=A0AAV4TGS1_CAEEX|nr:hypothetical protein CEXT_667571 [Caerostris extrusa]
MEGHSIDASQWKVHSIDASQWKATVLMRVNRTATSIDTSQWKSVLMRINGNAFVLMRVNQTINIDPRQWKATVLIRVNGKQQY